MGTFECGLVSYLLIFIFFQNQKPYLIYRLNEWIGAFEQTLVLRNDLLECFATSTEEETGNGEEEGGEGETGGEDMGGEGETGGENEGNQGGEGEQVP